MRGHLNGLDSGATDDSHVPRRSPPACAREIAPESAEKSVRLQVKSLANQQTGRGSQYHEIRDVPPQTSVQLRAAWWVLGDMIPVTRIATGAGAPRRATKELSRPIASLRLWPICSRARPSRSYWSWFTTLPTAGPQCADSCLRTMATITRDSALVRSFSGGVEVAYVREAPKWQTYTAKPSLSSPSWSSYTASFSELPRLHPLKGDKHKAFAVPLAEFSPWAHFTIYDPHVVLFGSYAFSCFLANAGVMWAVHTSSPTAGGS